MGLSLKGKELFLTQDKVKNILFKLFYTKQMPDAFSHDDLEIKQHFLNLAREYRTKADSLESELAAALLYMNVADYLAEYLIISLTEMSKEAVSKYYLGIVSMRPPKRDSFNIGESMKYLERYDFPRKGDILGELTDINKARKKIAHGILKTKSEQLEEVDKAVASLAEHTEELVVLVDEISPGLPPPTLIDLIQQIQPDSEPETPKKDKK